ncbi:MAG: sugar phosphate isomerase/epimerase family protein [Steroidobacteraceae bacterium]
MPLTALSRRTFLGRSTELGFLTLLTATLPRLLRSDPLGIPVGIQLYTVNQAMQSDPGATLQKLRQIGYRNVESAGFVGLSAKDFRRLLDDAGLACPSAHLDFMSGNVEANLADARALGATYVVSSILRPGSGELPRMDPSLSKYAGMMRAMTLEDAKQTAVLANRIGEQAKQAGLRYAYHNHFMEFVDQGLGKVAYDVLLRETDPDLVGFEIDCGWMKVAGHDPVHYFRKYPGRFPMIHVKDFLKATRENAGSPAMRVGTELGHGFVDYKPIFAAAKAQGLKYYFVEQEAPFKRMSQLDAAQVDYDYLHAMSA